MRWLSQDEATSGHSFVCLTDKPLTTWNILTPSGGRRRGDWLSDFRGLVGNWRLSSNRPTGWSVVVLANGSSPCASWDAPTAMRCGSDPRLQRVLLQDDRGAAASFGKRSNLNSAWRPSSTSLHPQPRTERGRGAEDWCLARLGSLSAFTSRSSDGIPLPSWQGPHRRPLANQQILPFAVAKNA